MELHELVQSLLTVAPIHLVDDDSAARAIVGVRWPGGARCILCPSMATLRGNMLVCDDERCDSAFSIFVGTPLGSLRRPRPRALLLALRAMATDKRGISARGLARIVAVPHVTIWRHLHRLRELLPCITPGSRPGAFVQVCARRGGPDSSPASASIGRASTGFSYATAGSDCVTTEGAIRIVGESLRTWLCGTFHGVTARYLACYLREATARSTHAPRDCLAHPLARLLAPPPCAAV